MLRRGMLLLGSFAVAAHALVAPGSQAAIAGLMKKHDPILLYVQNLLSESTAEDAGALYAWCRRLDQIVDDPPAGSSVADTRAALDEWAARLDSLCDGQPRDEMDAALTEAFRRHPTLSRQPFADMIAAHCRHWIPRGGEWEMMPDPSPEMMKNSSGPMRMS